MKILKSMPENWGFFFFEVGEMGNFFQYGQYFNIEVSNWSGVTMIDDPDRSIQDTILGYKKTSKMHAIVIYMHKESKTKYHND
eukprot:UN11176